MNLHIPGIDIDKAVQNSGSMELFLELLNDVYKIIDEKSDLIETYVKEKDLNDSQKRIACRFDFFRVR